MKPKWAVGHEPILGTRCIRCRRRCQRDAYKPYCSFHCQEWASMDANLAYVNQRVKENWT